MNIYLNICHVQKSPSIEPHLERENSKIASRQCKNYTRVTASATVNIGQTSNSVKTSCLTFQTNRSLLGQDFVVVLDCGAEILTQSSITINISIDTNHIRRLAALIYHALKVLQRILG